MKRIVGWMILCLLLLVVCSLLVFGLIAVANTHGWVIALAVFPGVPVGAYILITVIDWALGATSYE